MSLKKIPDKLRELTTSEVGEPELVAWVSTGGTHIYVGGVNGPRGPTLWMDTPEQRQAMARWLREAADYLDMSCLRKD